MKFIVNKGVPSSSNCDYCERLCGVRCSARNCLFCGAVIMM